MWLLLPIVPRRGPARKSVRYPPLAPQRPPLRSSFLSSVRYSLDVRLLRLRRVTNCFRAFSHLGSEYQEEEIEFSAQIFSFSSAF